MQLKIKLRSAKIKNEGKKLRREGMIPAVLYSNGKEGEVISVSKAEFAKALQQIEKGRLSTTKFSLVDDNGAERQAIVKDIQYDITTYDIIHLDFKELHSDITVNVRVPIECTGIVDCVGIKLGGVLRQVIRFVLVNCLPKDIPECFKMDISALALKDAKRLKDIQFPQGVVPKARLNEVAVAIVKR